MSQKRPIRNPASFIKTANLSLKPLCPNHDDPASALPSSSVFALWIQVPESPASPKPA